MHVAECAVGQFRVYAAAIQVPSGSGYHAGVVVRDFGADGKGRYAFRDEELEEAKVWVDPEEALEVALRVGRAAVHAQHALGLFRAA
jgi:hypothetical protein